MPAMTRHGRRTGDPFLRRGGGHHLSHHLSRLRLRKLRRPGGGVSAQAHNAKLLYPVLDKLYLRDQKPQDGLTVKSNGMLVRLPFSQLSYVEVNGKHLFFNMADGTVYEVAASMREYEGALLARPEFMRVHRSYIVNMLQAEKLSPAGVITFSGHNVPVSRLLYGQLQKDYLALLFSGRDA